MQLCDSKLWFHGPEFLHSIGKELEEPIQILDDVPDRKPQKLVLLLTEDSNNFIDLIRHSNKLKKLQRIIAFCLRFIYNSHQIIKRTGPIQINELELALTALIKDVQRTTFTLELQSLKKGERVQRNSRLHSLNPFLDNQGLICVGGRLQNSNLPFQSKHQLLLPKNHSFTLMLLIYLHEKLLHAAPQTLLAITRLRFWPIDGKNITRKVVNRCIRCFHTKPKSIEHMMGNLPIERVQPGRPFSITGVDFCGPVKAHFKIRGKAPGKAYIAIFICFKTRAVHMEQVTDLSSDAFIAALKRFIGRRGLCCTIFCDNATNFMGARAELNELHKLFTSENHAGQVQGFCEEEAIIWKPIPPRSPHFEGLWEAAVKSVKYHLVRVVANASLTFEELNTVIIQIEAVLNSRPLTQLSSDPNDLEALTPGHFLIGAPLTAMAEPELNSKLLPNARYKHIRQMQQHFWSRWSAEYLNQLKQRYKWTSKVTNIKLGCLVLLKDDNLPPLKWALGRVVHLYHGADQIVRVVDVKTKHGTFKRATRNLCPLPILE